MLFGFGLRVRQNRIKEFLLPFGLEFQPLDRLIIKDGTFTDLTGEKKHFGLITDDWIILFSDVL